MSGAMPDSASMYCRQCGYVLDGLPEQRCAECGTAFDPADERTFRRDVKRPNSLRMVLAVYAFVLAICFLLCSMAVMVEQTPIIPDDEVPVPWSDIIMAFFWFACGPVDWLLSALRLSATAGLFVCPLIWGAWIVCLWRMPKVRNIDYGVHLLIGFAWCFSGCFAVPGL